MFADNLSESAPHLGHRSVWTKLLSVVLQSLVLAAALAIPFFHIEGLQVIPPPPSIRLTSAQPPQVRTEMPRFSHSASPTPYEIVLPSSIPSTIARTIDHQPGSSGPPDAGPVRLSNCAGVAMSELFKPEVFSVPPPQPVKAPVHVSQMQLGELVRKVLPEYPIAAKQLHIQGQVVLMATVGKDGRVEDVKTLSGPPLLVLPAKHAVEQWQYRPYRLNHEPVEVQTQITVNFLLNAQ